MQPITITLDGREVSGQPGMTILELANESGVHIPTLCYDAHLNSVGACRICLVEDERSGKLLASCVTPIAPGMLINTQSPQVLEHRSNIVKLMLASHPDTCLVCDKGNRCQLHQVASDLGIGLVEFDRIPQIAAIEEVNPFIERDMTKCILCARCIRACLELVVEGAIDYFQRGFITRPATLNNLPLETSECTFCGTCVSMCPTGALAEKQKTYRGTTKTAGQTICPLCSCGCGISLEVKDNKIIRALPGKDDSVNNGALCIRGSYYCDFVNSANRLTKPLIKVDDSFEESSWDEALKLVATRFQRLKEDYGANSIAVLGSSKCTNEDNYLLQRFARCVLGTNNIDNGSRIYGSATQIGLGSLIGYTMPRRNIKDLEQADVILVVGADPESSTPIVSYAIKRAVKFKGAKLILIDPRETKLAAFAHLWLRPNIGTDIALFNGIAKVIIDQDLLDKEFVTRRTDNFKSLTDILGKYSLENVEAITGIAKQEIISAAQLYSQADQAAIVYGTGITQYINGLDAVKALANLAILTGNIGQNGGGIYALHRENNSLGACDFGSLPDYLPGYCSVADAKDKSKFEEYWKAVLPSEPGLSALEIIEAIKQGKIKGLYIVGENPVLSFPHPSLVADVLNSVDLIVVQDMFLTETARLATVVLPAASFAEREGTFTNVVGKIQQLNKVLEPAGDCLPDWEIIVRLAKSMNSPMPFSSIKQVMDEIEKLVPIYGGSNDSVESSYQEGKSTKERYVYGKHLLDGFARFSPVEYTQHVSMPSKDYPFRLLTGSTQSHAGTGSRTSRASRLKASPSSTFVEICKSDAEKLSIGEGDTAKITSPTGTITATVKISDTLPEQMVFIPDLMPENPFTELFDYILDPKTKTPSLKTCNVKIERTGIDG